MKLLVIGHARHGKDSLCEILQQDHGLRFTSSSYFAAERAVRPWLAVRGLLYPNLKACYDDRARHRPAWFQAIAEYNSSDPARLAREMLRSHDIYCGMRSRREFEAAEAGELFDAVIWVDASQRVELEPLSSNELRQQDGDFVVDNNRDPHDLKREADFLMTKLRGLLG